MRYLFIALLCVATSVGAAELTGQDIMSQVADRKRPADSRATVRMVLVNKRNEKRERTVEIFAKEQDDLSRSLIRFEDPADVKGTGFLVLEQEEGDDVQILYLPALKKTRRISSSQKGQSFMGTDFSYEDLSVADIDEDADHKLLREETLEGHDVWVVESVPRPEKDSQYSKIVNWVRKDLKLPIKAVFYDQKGKELKQMTVRTVETVGEYDIATQTMMENLQRGTKTFLISPKESYKVDVGLGDDLFTERNLAAQ